MKTMVISLVFILLIIQSLIALEHDSSYVEENMPTWHILAGGGAQSFIDEWMRTTYGLSPYFGCEFSKRVSPIIDGVTEIGFCMKTGTHIYEWYLDAQHYTLTYGKLSLALRACDRRMGEGSPFVELGIDAAHVRENSDNYSQKGSAIGTHVGAGYWCYVGSKWIVQAKGKFQFMAISFQSQGSYPRSYEVDLSGLELAIGVGFRK